MHAAIDANKSGGIPLGGWTSFENDTAPNDDWIQAGTTFDSDTYPELFLYLGGNTVPQMFDHSRLNETFDNTVDLSATTLENAYTCPYDGFIYWATNQISSTTNLRIYVNNTETFAWVQGSGTSEKQYGVLPVKKGDKVWHLGTATFEYHNARWYTHPLFIKATTTASSYTPSTAMQEIKDYTKDYVDASNSYSTEETLTGGTWIDGKPIYRRTFHFNTMLSVGQYVYTVNVGQADFDTWIKTYYIGRRSNMPDIMTANFPTWTANNYTGFKISVNDQEAMFVDYIILEYTKKTTP